MTVKVRVKVCYTCKVKKPISCYYKNKNMRDGYLRRCKKCILESKGNTYRNNPEFRKKVLASNRLKRTGWSMDKYDEAMEKQNGMCAICGKVCVSGRALSADHNHKTLKPRGLLCGKCNRGIGLFEDSPELLRAAYEYLKIYE